MLIYQFNMAAKMPLICHSEESRTTKNLSPPLTGGDEGEGA